MHVGGICLIGEHRFTNLASRGGHCRASLVTAAGARCELDVPASWSSQPPPRLVRPDSQLELRPHAAPNCRDKRHLRSEEHTSELQSQSNLVCRLLLEK